MGCYGVERWTSLQSSLKKFGQVYRYMHSRVALSGLILQQPRLDCKCGVAVFRSAISSFFKIIPKQPYKY